MVIDFLGAPSSVLWTWLGLGLAVALREKKTSRQYFASERRAPRMPLRLAPVAVAQIVRMNASRSTNKQMPHPKAANKE
jgi:hypothetical protein